MSALHLATDLVQLVPLAAGGDDLIGWGTDKTTEVGSLFRVLSRVVGMGFVIYVGIKSRGALAAIIMAGIAAAVFMYLVNNVTEVQDRVDNEVNSQHGPRVTDRQDNGDNLPVAPTVASSGADG